MHQLNVIHRDLKLGNLFLDRHLSVKIGDLGLATKLTHENERKRTICGTPNYIAPEIIDGKGGHSFQVSDEENLLYFSTRRDFPSLAYVKKKTFLT